MFIYILIYYLKLIFIVYKKQNHTNQKQQTDNPTIATSCHIKIIITISSFLFMHRGYMSYHHTMIL